MRLRSGDPRLQEERQARLVEPPGGLHSDEDVLQRQFTLGDTDDRGHTSSDPIGAAAAGPGRALRVPARGGSLLDGALERAAGLSRFGGAAGAQLKIHVQDDEEDENQTRQPATGPSPLHGRTTTEIKLDFTIKPRCRLKSSSKLVLLIPLLHLPR